MDCMIRSRQGLPNITDAHEPRGDALLRAVAPKERACSLKPLSAMPDLTMLHFPIYFVASSLLEFIIAHPSSMEKEKKKKLRRQRKLSLHQLRKERHVGSKSRESPSPADEREINVDRVGFWQHAA
eukprot:1151251-Pelagomonas_calceolata.AAC.7